MARSLATVPSAAVVGIEACMLEVEVHLTPADGALNGAQRIVLGLPDASVRESRNRVRSAMQNAGYAFPWDKNITVNLAPADLRKEGPAYDLSAN
jgi:magnesium chelatase family protein